MYYNQYDLRHHFLLFICLNKTFNHNHTKQEHDMVLSITFWAYFLLGGGRTISASANTADTAFWF